jgi:hypothetical protein
MRWEGPYRVVEKKSNVSYKKVSDDGKKLMAVHAIRMEKFQGRASPQATNVVASSRVTKSKALGALQQKNTVGQHRYNLKEKIKAP